jgi:hypothetical protein
LQEEEYGYFLKETLMKVNFEISNLKNQKLGSGIGKKFKLKHEKNVLNRYAFQLHTIIFIQHNFYCMCVK